ncbi:MAG: hypothetical protein ACOH17_03180 [Cellulomonas sp.]
MTLVVNLLLVLHLVGWAMVLGGVLAHMKKPVVPVGALHGILTALVTGILMAGLLHAMPDEHPNDVKFAVKFVVALVVAGLVIVGRRTPAKVTAGFLGMIAGLVVLNVGIAVLWS